MVKLPYTVLNAFSSSPNTGNPAAVIVLPPPTTTIDPTKPFDSYPPTHALQNVATQLNFPMTAFLLPKGENGSYLLRWLDPGTEVQLCGHATIALSHYLFSQADAPAKLDLMTVHHNQVVAQRMSNPLKPSETLVALDFPEILGFTDISQNSDEWEEVVSGLAQLTQTEKEKLPIKQLRRSVHYLIIELEAGFDMSAQGLPLDMEKLNHFEGSSLLLTQPTPTAKEAKGPHIHTRVLHSYASKKDEDGATGSAHCALIPHYFSSEAHRSTFAQQCYDLQAISVVQQSKETGEMVVQWFKDRKKVRIFGDAVDVGQGEVDLEL